MSVELGILVAVTPTIWDDKLNNFSSSYVGVKDSQ